MKVKQTDLDGVLIIEPEVFGDARGWFMETYTKSKWKKQGIAAEFVQDNHSFSAHRGTLRGLHFQNAPMAQAKLVRCVKGAVLDVAVDLRRASPNYKKWTAVQLSEGNKKQLFIPKGFAHAFLTLTDDVEFLYKTDNYYSKEYDRSIRWDDPDIGINWGILSPILSEKDKYAPLLRDCDADFL